MAATGIETENATDMDIDTAPSMASTVDITLPPGDRALAEVCACMKNIDFCRYELKYVIRRKNGLANDLLLNNQFIELSRKILIDHVPKELAEEIIDYTDVNEKINQIEESLKQVHKHESGWQELLNEANEKMVYWRNIMLEMDHSSCEENNNICE